MTGEDTLTGSEDTNAELDAADTVTGAEGGEGGEDTTEGADAGADTAPGGAPDGDAVVDEVVISIGDDKPEEDETQAAPTWVKELRANYRELQRRNRELEAQLRTTTEPKIPVVGKKPTLEDVDYDAEKYDAALLAWNDAKRQAEQAEAQSRQAQEAQQKTWQEKLDTYARSKGDLKVKDFEGAEATTLEALNVTQQGIIIHGAKNPAQVIYALGKSPARLKELAALSDPVLFAIAIGDLESKLKVTPRKAPPAPERTVDGASSGAAGAVDNTLERLRAEAAKTGNMTKVIQYKAKMKRAARS